MDIKSVFLNEYLNEEVYVAQLKALKTPYILTMSTC